MKYNYTVATIALALLTGCASPRQTAFNEADFQSAGGKGSGVVTGRAYVQTEDRGTLYPHNQQITLWPVNAYTTENVQRRFLHGEKLQAADRRAVPYLHAATTDYHGNFAIRGVPSGDYYLEGEIPWVTSSHVSDVVEDTETWEYVNHFKYYFARVSVKNGQTVNVTQFDQRSPERYTHYSSSGLIYRPPAGAEIF